MTWKLVVSFAGLVLLIIAGCESGHDGERAAERAEPPQQGRHSADDVPKVAADSEPSEAAPTEVDATKSRADASLQAAQNAAAANDLETATKRVREHLLKFPDDPAGLFLAAQLTAARGDYFEAAELLGGIPPDHPQAGVAALGQAADWMLAAQRWEEAERRYEKLLERAPSANLAHRRLAHLFNRQGRRQEAASHVRILCRAGDVTQAELHTLINECEAIYDQQLADRQGQSDHSPIGATAEARILYSENRFEEALDVLREPWRKAELPASGRAFFGRLAMEVDDVDAINAWLGRSDPAQERFGDYWFALGTRLLSEGNDPAGAARLFCEAIVRTPTDWVAVTRLENCLDLLGDVEGVKACRARAIGLRTSIRLHGELVGQQHPDPERISKLAATLDQLGRPIEAVMWRAIAVIERGGDKSALQQLNRTRRRLVETTSAEIEARQALAGISPSRFPLPGDWRDSLSASPLSEKPRALSQHAAAVAPRMPDVAERVGIDFQYFNAAQPKFADTQLYEQFGGGAAALDYDLDGRVDVFFNQSGADPKSSTRGRADRLFRGLDEAFTRADRALPTEDGYGQGVTAGDWNQDGFPDLAVANFGVNVILINQGDGTFRRVEHSTLGPDWSKSRWTSSLAMGDIDGDHRPDLYEVNYVDDPQVHEIAPRGPNGRFTQSRGPESYRAAHDRVFLRRGSGLDVLHLDRGRTGTQTHGLGVVLTDVDGNAGNEIFVANDTDANQLWVRTNARSAEPLQLVDVAGLRGCAHSGRGGSGASMGIATADFDGNGMIDFHATNFLNEPVHLYLQDRDNNFRDSVVKSRLYRDSMPVLGFGTQAADFDNNGTVDLAVVNGHIDDLRYKGIAHRMRPQLFLGTGGRFEPVPAETLSDGYWNRPAIGRGLLKLDWNRDGRVDLLATHHDVPAALLENQTGGDHHWLQLKLVGTVCERDAIGASVTVRLPAGQLIDVVTSGDGYACKNEALLAFGLGTSDRVDEVTVRWPTGETETFALPTVNRRYLLVQSSGQAWPVTASSRVGLARGR